MISNYLFSLLAIGISAVLTILFSRGRFLSYFDFPAAIITVVLPFMYQWALFGPGGIKTAFTAAFRKNLSMEEMEGSLLFFRAYSKIIWLSVLLPVVIGAVAILKWVTPDDYTLLGPNFAAALMSLLYAVVLHAFVILPYSVILKRRVIALNIEI
ncbi:MAG: hypothetical protein LBK63_11425 [Treponema sp.]|jgi:hypothetical protein|nr:hypothetical protein [Treponema sp.]